MTRKFETKKSLRIRSEEDSVELTRPKRARLQWLESRVEEIVATTSATYRYLEAAQALQALKPHIGYPSETGRVRLAAKLHQHLAWFYSHSGLASSSIAEATYSIGLYEIVYQNTGDKDALRELGGSCLIRSNSQLISGNVTTAQATLDLAREATEAAGVSLNSEFFRQSGVAYFQARENEIAKAMFERATRDGDGRSIALKMASDRFLNLMALPFPNVDEELVLRDEAQSVYGTDSLQATMCVHWAAACGLSTDSQTLKRLSLDLIEANKANSERFGHQATIAKLLPIAIELPANKRPLWVRVALYQDAYRNS